MRIDGDGWHLRPERPDDAPEMARAFAEDPHLAVDWGIEVAPDAYYFRTTPVFEVRAGPHEWLRRHVFVARGIRKPDHVIVDFYRVD